MDTRIMPDHRPLPHRQLDQAAIDAAIQGVPTDRLTTGSLRAQLGAGPHDTLCDLLGVEVPA